MRVRTLYERMSMGTERIILHQDYDPGTHFARMFSFPQLQTCVLAVGEIDAMGREVHEFAIGQNVYLRKGHGSHQVLDAQHCSPIPDGIDLKQATWCGLAKTAFRAAYAAGFKPDDSVLIVGTGPVGQMAVRWAHSARVAEIAVATCLRLASSWPAEAVPMSYSTSRLTPRSRNCTLSAMVRDQTS